MPREIISDLRDSGVSIEETASYGSRNADVIYMTRIQNASRMKMNIKKLQSFQIKSFDRAR